MRWLIAACTVGCAAPEPLPAGPDMVAPFEAPVSASPFPAIQADIRVFPHPTHPLLVVVEVEASGPVTVEVEVDGPGVVARVEGPEERAADHRYVIAALRAESLYDVRVTLRGGLGRTWSQDFQVETGEIPIRIPKIRVTDPGDPGGVFLVGLREDLSPRFGMEALFLAIDAEGQVVWYDTDPAEGAELPLIRRRADGTFFVTYEGETRIVDRERQTVARVVRREGDEEWHHDRIELADGRHLVLAFEMRRMNTPFGVQNVLGDTVLEYDPVDNKIHNRWSALDTLDTSRFPTGLSREVLNGGLDWTHGNALEVTPDGEGWVVSLRHQHWIVRVDRRNQRVIWRLGEGGDFTLTRGLWFDAQHAPKFMEEDRLLVYDNGVERHRAGGLGSRVVRYRLDYALRLAAEEWSWNLPYYTPVVGDVQPWGDRVLVTAGGRQDGTTSVWLVTESGQIDWGIEIDSFAFRGELVETL